MHRARQLPGVHLIAILPDPRMRLRLLPPRAHLRRDDVGTRRGARVQNDGRSPRYRTSGPSTPLVAVGGVSIDGYDRRRRRTAHGVPVHARDRRDRGVRPRAAREARKFRPHHGGTPVPSSGGKEQESVRRGPGTQLAARHGPELAHVRLAVPPPTTPRACEGRIVRT